MFGLQHANVSTRSSSHPQGTSEGSCENAGALLAWMLRLRACVAQCSGQSASANVLTAGAVGPSPPSPSLALALA